jgi:SAM-dependent methyltransferase
MRSLHADTFNHDGDASKYDRIVQNESDPIRAGYREVLAWTVREAKITSKSVVVDLGVGTGNTSQLIEACGSLVAVDVSAKMMAKARKKLSHLNSVRYVQADLLEYFDGVLDEEVPMADAYISTYTVHHLMEDEKSEFFQRIYNHLKPGGMAVFGDLMFEDADGREAVIANLLRLGHTDAVADIGEEFFWDVASAVEELERIGFRVRTKRFSDLSWGIACCKPL